MKYGDTLRQARILLVDDEIGCLSLLENVLSRLGFANLRKLANAQQILQEFDRYQPDLLITDLAMPSLPGVELVKRIRAHLPDDEFLPVLVLTGNTDPRVKRQALLAGATDLLLKPFDASELQMRIHNLLQMRLQRIEIQNQNALLEMKVAERTAELKQALTDLKDSQQHVVQQERFRAFGEMAGGVVHDFNNSLMSIIGYSELLLEDPALMRDPAAVQNTLQTINTAGRDAAQVISRLRDFYRPREASDVFAPTDVNRVLEEIVALTRPKWHDQALQTGRAIEVVLELTKVAPVFGNAAELREVLTNLVFNAVDAMPVGGIIALRSRNVGDCVEMEVADSGAGMTEEVRRRCLEPFFSTKGESGTGLGLSVSAGIIRRHDGTISIDHAPSGGTVFRIRLPAYHQVARPSSPAPARWERALHVLVATDHPHTREIVTRYLLGDGHELIAAGNGAEALACVDSRDFDLLISDHGMPGMSGVQLADAAKQLQPSLKTILLSGFAMAPEDQPGCVDYVLKKPLARNDLRNALHAALSGNGSAQKSAALAGAHP
jgi:signal transduction histidine kinase